MGRDFDAKHAQCSKAGDKEQILGIISVAFGGIDCFNAVLRATVEKASPLGSPRFDSHTSSRTQFGASQSSTWTSSSSGGSSESEGSACEYPSERKVRSCAFW